MAPSFSGRTLVDMLRWRADEFGTRTAFCFLEGADEEQTIDYGTLDDRARAVAVALGDCGAVPGDRAVLLFPPGFDYIATFLGCLYAGVIAVPAYVPEPSRAVRTVPRLSSIARDAGASLALTTSDGIALTEWLFGFAPELRALRWLATDDVLLDVGGAWRPPAVSSCTPAFLQYTSGTTAMPKGVVQSHGNVLHNLSLIRTALDLGEETVGLSWLPPYHDMGLIGFILEPVYLGGRSVLMSPLTFLQHPLRWLRAVGSHHATITGAPNFAYDLCVRKTTPEQRAQLDFTTLRSAGCAAEPVRPQTLARFSEAFACAGFTPEKFYPCFGLAEATLIVSGGDVAALPRVRSLDRAALRAGRVLDAAGETAERVVSCGRALPGDRIAIVDPESRNPVGPGEVGEIWVQSPSVGLGYWGREEESGRTFRAALGDGGEGPFLRTGDLGFLDDGELFVTGRIKDVIVIHGAKHYPDGIERTAEGAHPRLRPGGGAAFAVTIDGEERVVVLHELESDCETEEVVAALRQAVAEAHEIQLHAVVLLSRGSLLRTSSGKLQRHLCRTAFLEGEVDPVAVWTRGAPGTERARPSRGS